jgi:sortase (surface protein transpeptidase)
MTVGRRRRAAAAAAAAGLALLAGCSGSGAAEPEPGSAGSPRASVRGASWQRPQQPASGLDAVRGFRSVRGYRATPVPVRVEIPRIGVSSSLVLLGREPDGTVQVPRPWDRAGWYAHGPRPGDPGSAVILGHVDSKSGPAVFYRLRELRPGDRIQVLRADGSRLWFVVERTEQYDKQRFPTDEVYYPTLRSTLRLVTCGGVFDRSTGHYRSNVIVFATATT